MSRVITLDLNHTKSSGIGGSSISTTRKYAGHRNPQIHHRRTIPGGKSNSGKSNCCIVEGKGLK
jgi:hypothetical protein